MGLAPIRAIKRRLVSGRDDFVRIAMDLLTLFGADPRYAGLGEPTESQMLCRLVRQGAHREAGRRIRLSGPFLGIPEVHLLHGGFRKDGCAVGVFFFEDVGLGVMSVSPLAGERPQTVMILMEAEPVSGES